MDKMLSQHVQVVLPALLNIRMLVLRFIHLLSSMMIYGLCTAIILAIDSGQSAGAVDCEVYGQQS